MPAADHLHGSLNLLVLKLLANRAPLHGYAIMSAIQIASEEILRVEQGSLYPALHRMEEAGWIGAEWTVTESGKRVRAYTLTTRGRQELEAAEQRWTTVTSAVNRVLKMA
jgi:PadR family transcriptional regulator PadR